MLTHVQLFVTPWTIAYQAPLSIESSRQEYWSGLLFPPPWDLSNPGIGPLSLLSPELVGEFFTTAPLVYINTICSVLDVYNIFLLLKYKYNVHMKCI